MCPLSDDALLDWALAPREADPEIDRHLKACDDCRVRAEAVLREQELLRRAYDGPAVPAALSRGLAVARPAPLWSRLGVAALLLVTVAIGVLLARSASHPAAARSALSHRHRPLAPIQTDLNLVAERIAAARETLPEAEDQRASTAYLQLLAQEEQLYLEGMAHYLGEGSPLSAEQEQELRRTVQGFYGVLWTGENLAAASREFRGRVRGLLNDDQFTAFEEFSRQGMEWQWKTDIAILMDDLSGELDLRFSEAEKLRLALETNYPRADVPVARTDRCPSDPLIDNPGLSGVVRNSLDPSYRRKFDTYLGQVQVARERALKIVRRARSSN